MQKPKTLEELKQNRVKIVNVNAEQESLQSRLDKTAIWITEHVGTMGFFLLIFFWTITWLGWNMFAPTSLRFDPFPGFVLWLFISNLVQIFLMPLIMVGQNIQASHAEARAEADFQVNTKAEEEIETILIHLENQNKLILDVLQKLEKYESAANTGTSNS
jgi:uncharacterized membrane protein